MPRNVTLVLPDAVYQAASRLAQSTVRSVEDVLLDALENLVEEAAQTKPPYTKKQGQYLAFVHHYTKLHGEPPSEADMQYFFRTSPPSVHQMVVRLEALGLISKVPGQPRTIRVLLPPAALPELE